MKYFYTFFCCILFNVSGLSQEIKSIGFREAPTLSINGDFDGDGVIDELKQFVADSLGNELKLIVDGETWEDTVYLYSKYGYYNVFTLNNKITDIPTYISVGLYCLINLGNINNSEGDEIAFVPDLSDFSRMNTCRIFSLCKGEWTELFKFNIHEGVFDYKGDKAPIFKNIPETLKRRKKKWYYYDYIDMDYDGPEEVGKMKEIKVKACN